MIKNYPFNIQRFVEVPNTNIKEPVLQSQWADELCLQIADDYGYAEVVGMLSMVRE